MKTSKRSRSTHRDACSCAARRRASARPSACRSSTRCWTATARRSRAGTPLPKRFGEFYWGNGVNVKSWYPSGDRGRLAAHAAADAARQRQELHLGRLGNGRLHPVHRLGPHGLAAVDHLGRLGTPQGGLNYAFAGQTMDVAIADEDRHDDPLQVAAPRRRVDRHQRRRLRRAGEVDLAQRPEQPQPARVRSDRALRSRLRRRLLAAGHASRPASRR